jgi:hypothetical protein
MNQQDNEMNESNTDELKPSSTKLNQTAIGWGVGGAQSTIVSLVRSDLVMLSQVWRDLSNT